MIDALYYILAVLTLPVGALLVTHYAGWTLERDLAQSQRERLKAQADSAGKV